jgi:DNA polymerase III delta subunit
LKPADPPPIFREWLSGDPAPAYLLYGDGAGLAGLLARAWEGKLRGEGVPIESFRWTLEDLARESPTAAWRSPSFFSRVRIFTLPDLAEMKKAHRDEIKAYLESPEPSATLILHGTDFRQARGFSSLRNLLSNAPREEKAVEALARHAVRAAAEGGAKLSRESALFLARWVGASFDALDAEIGKVLAFAAGRGEVVEEDIRAVCVSRGAVDPWKLAEALIRKDVTACLDAVRRFAAAAEPEDYHRLNGALAWHLRSRIQGMKGGVAVAPRRAAEIFRALSRIDREMKGESRLPPGQVFEIRLLSLLA